MIRLLSTPATRLLGIDVPILQAGMSWASSDSGLPLAVSRAGALGVIAAGPMRIADLGAAIDAVRAGTERPFAVNLPLYRRGVDEAIDLLLAKRIPILIAGQGGPGRYLDRFQGAGTICLHVVASPEHAVKAADAGVDALVVVGAEAGGHPPPSMVSTLVLVRAVARAVPNLPIIAAGGFADGYGLAAGLALGASAVQFGTRFLASEEANVHPAYKAAVLRAGITDALAVGRGLGVIRALRNEFTTHMLELEERGARLEERRAAFGDASLRTAAAEGDVARGKVEAGQAAGLINDLQPAAEIVRRLLDEYYDALHGLPT